MLCEICKQNEAECVLHRKDASGEDEELYVCKKCREAADGDASAKNGDGSQAKPSFVAINGEPPPEFIQNFLDAAVGLIEGVVKSEGKAKDPKCPVCGSTWNTIKETREIRCPDCWTQFASEIRGEFLKRSYGPTHKGLIPQQTSDGRPSRAFLEKELEIAVAKQNYRKAAKIRKLLDEMDGSEK